MERVWAVRTGKGCSFGKEPRPCRSFAVPGKSELAVEKAAGRHDHGYLSHRGGRPWGPTQSGPYDRYGCANASVHYRRGNACARGAYGPSHSGRANQQCQREVHSRKQSLIGRRG